MWLRSKTSSDASDRSNKLPACLLFGEFGEQMLNCGMWIVASFESRAVRDRIGDASLLGLQAGCMWLRSKTSSDASDRSNKPLACLLFGGLVLRGNLP